MGPKVGVTVIVYKRGRVLIGQRKSDHGRGLWGLPGGHLEQGEEPIDAAIREMREETGLDLLNPAFYGMTCDIFSPDEHYITLFISGNVEGEAQTLEPDKCEGWEWINLADIPEEELFLPVRNYVQGKFHYGYQG